jgi:hypothetical protein
MNATKTLLALTTAALALSVSGTCWAAGKREAPASLHALVSQDAADKAFDVVSNHVSSLDACYRNLPKTVRAAGAKLELSFTVGQNGRASDIRVDGPALKGTTIPACVGAAVARWPFPAGVGARVSFPLEFVVE